MLGRVFRALFGPSKRERVQESWSVASQLLKPKVSVYRAGLTEISPWDFDNAAKQTVRRCPLIKMESEKQREERLEIRTGRQDRERRLATAERVYASFFEREAASGGNTQEKDRAIRIEGVTERADGLKTWRGGKAEELEKKLHRGWEAANDNHWERER